MRKKLTLSIDEDVYEKLQFVPRGFSVSEFVSFMLRGMLREVGSMGMSQEQFEEWVKSDPELKRIREGIREAWGPTLNPVIEKIDNLKAKVGVKRKSSKGGHNK
jgi:predicted CopG family antitoxin